MYNVTRLDMEGNCIPSGEQILIGEDLRRFLYDVIHEKADILAIENHEKAG